MEINNRIGLYTVVAQIFLNSIMMRQPEVFYITDTTVNLTSPSFPHLYPPNTEIKWIVDTCHLMVMNITVRELQLEVSEGCKFDALHISDLSGTPLHDPMCGNASRFPYLTLSLEDYGYQILFISDDTIEYKGFSLDVVGVMFPNDDVCNRMNLEEEKRIVSSVIKHREKYATNLNCTWEISSLADEQIIVDFAHFNIEFSGQNCVFDRFEVWDISRENSSDERLLGKYCGHLNPWVMSTSSRNIRLNFFSDESSNSGSFAVHYSFASLSKDTERKVIYQMVDAELQSGDLSGILSEYSCLISWHFRTQPGYHVIFNINETAINNSTLLYDGPDLSYPKIALNKEKGLVKTGWFHVILETDSPVVLQFFASQNYTLGSNIYLASSLLRQIPDYPNDNNCAHAGVAVYDKEVSFNSLKAVLCQIKEQYVDVIKRITTPGSILLFYLYNRKWSSIYMYAYKNIDDGPERCRSEFLRSDILLSDSIYQDPVFNFTVLRVNDYESNIVIEYQEASGICVVLYLLPYSMGNEIKADSSDMSFDANVNFHLRSSTDVLICDNWGYLSSSRSKEKNTCSQKTRDCKYKNLETCTHQRTGGVDRKATAYRLQIISGWSLQFIRITLGKTSDKMCFVIWPTLADPDPVSHEYCGYLEVRYTERELQWTLAFPENKVSNTYYWYLKIEVAMHDPILIKEEHKGLNISVLTSLSLYDVTYRYRSLRYYSMTGVTMIFTFMPGPKSLIQFDSLSLNSSTQEIYSEELSGNNICYENHCYMLKTQRKPTSWHSAQRECQQNGGYLVSINSEQELTFLQKALAGVWFRRFYGNDRGLVYIGLNNLHEKREYIWEDGRPLTFRDWYSPFRFYQNVLPIQPRPPLDRSEIQPAANFSQRCVAMVPSNLGFSTNWRNVRCDDSVYDTPVYSICEFNNKNSDTNKQKSKISSYNNFASVQCNSGWTLLNDTCYVVARTGYPTIEINESYCLELGGRFPMKSTLGLLPSFLKATELGYWYNEVAFPVRLFDESIVCVSYSFALGKIIECSEWRYVQRALICETPPVSVNPTCSTYHFLCQDGSCLNPDRICDSIPDCINKEDEQNCNLTNYFTCDNRNTISLFKYCDMHTDCLDKSDEMFCVHPSCEKDQYRCRNGECVSVNQRCDLKPDCVDESDEMDCDFGLECKGFRCPGGGCLPKFLREDLLPDCPDGSQADETHNIVELKDNFLCSGVDESKSSKPMKRRLGLRKPNHYRCEMGHSSCYPGNTLCVYDHDDYGHLKHCRNGAHLRACRDISCQDMFKCNTSYCIPYHKVCDGILDCIGGEDESSCDDKACPGRLKCESGSQCVSLTEVCDGQVHCKDDWSDEMFCDLKNFTCPLNCSCLGYSINCNGLLLEDIPELSIKKNLRVLEVDRNNISLSNNTLRGLHYLAHLSLSCNRISALPVDSFVHVPNLIRLDLSGNNIKSIPPSVFRALTQLRILQLKGNRIEDISPGSFKGLSSLSTLDLSGMHIVTILPLTFSGLHTLNTLFLNNSKVKQIYPDTLAGFRNIKILSLENNPLELTGLDAFENVSASEIRLPERFCCFSRRFHRVAHCSPTPSVFTCSDILPNVSLKGFAWCMAVSAIIGNIFVIVWRFSLKLPDVASILIFNLSISDLLMGVYLLTLAVVDIRYRDYYPLYDKTWRESTICTIIGVLGFLSCEVSMLTLLLIAVDRTMKLAFPFSKFHFTRRSVWVTILLGWFISAMLSLSPVIFASHFEDYYSQNAICLPFNFGIERREGWELTTAVFVGINSVAIATIIALYTLVYFKLKESRIRSGRGGFLEYQVARKLSVVVITDMVCMAPIILTNIIVFFGYDINSHLSAILVSVVLPINSALNPYLFSLKAMRKQYRDKKQVKSSGSRPSKSL